jgi:hypothetical protein
MQENERKCKKMQELVSSSMPTEAKFQDSLLSRVVGWWVVGGWVGGEKSKLKLNSAQLELELGLSLAKCNFIENTKWN